ncbi:helix-turn-helix domain-containing protein [Anaerolactibacter massiliensis]|uniref:helix-turn-helix domain-containing protein n=1 Tax=Anaerolactibacter massiliensis TaxID=2044573 RepID=UPI000CFA439D|nr:helix-turn-helix domain-containing protein [Anaerolactibacter massiliensis]
MGRFSDLLSGYMNRQGAKAADLAVSCGMNRSMMYKILQGTRNLPSLSLIEQIGSFLRLSETEKERLKEAYTMDEDGEFIVRRRKSIEDMLKAMPADSGTFPLKASINITFPADIPDIVPLSSEEQINGILFNILLAEAENGHNGIRIFSNVLRNATLNSLLYILANHPETGCEHIISFSKSRSEVIPEEHNLTAFSRIIRCATINRQYNAYSFYSASAGDNDLIADFSTFFITQEYVLTCANDMKSAILCHSKEITEFYGRIWQHLKELSTPVISRFNGASSSLSFLAASNQPGGDELVRLEPFPCLFGQCDEKLIDEVMIQDIPERSAFLRNVLGILTNYRKQLNNPESHIFSIHSVRGFRKFAISGILPEIPRSFYTPFNHDQKIRLLNNYLNHLDQMNVCFMKEEKTTLADSICLTLVRNTVSLQVVDATGQPLGLSINEPGLYLDFKDYTGSLLKDPSLFMSKDQVKEYITYLIHQN